MKTALPFTIRAGALTVVAAACAARASLHTARRARWTGRTAMIALALLLLTAAVVYGWFGYPHNALATNSRIHWVDIYFDRKNNWYYTLVKLPHRVFYNAPYLLQALNGAVNVALMYAIGRTIFKRSRALPLLLAATYLGSSLMLLFANTAEDVQLNIAVLLAAYLLYLRRTTPWLGVALFLVVLGRPQLVVVWVAVVATEFLVGERIEGKGRIRTLLGNRFVAWNIAVAAALFAAWDGLLVVRHQNWLLRNGHLIDSPLISLKAIRVDGFTIYSFSGAYVLHSAWMYPTALLLAAAVALWRVRDLSASAQRALVFGLIVLTSCILVSEAEPLFYFNVRYLAYPFPFLIVAAFTIFDLPRAPRRRPALLGRPALAVLLCLSVVTMRWIAIDDHRGLLASSIARAGPHRQKIAAIVGDAKAGTTSTATGNMNYISYLLRRPVQSISSGLRPGTTFHGYVFTTGDGTGFGEVVWRDGRLILVKVP